LKTVFSDDRVILKKANTAKSGETVAALLTEKRRLKPSAKENQVIELVPANPKYPSLKSAKTIVSKFKES